MTHTVGVEEEFLVVDPFSGHPVPRAADLIGDAEENQDGSSLQYELSTAQVETATGVCTSLADVRTQLMNLRGDLAARADAVGVGLQSAGVPVVDAAAPLTPGERFERMGLTYGLVLGEYRCCACQVHVGVPDKQAAVAVVDRVRRWLPTLLAISVNSPLADGQDTGYGSWRMVLQSRLPGGGVPPKFGSVDNYDRMLATLVDAGVLIDERMTFWVVRPSPTQPTVEFRVADAAPDVEGSLLQAALSRALVRQELDDMAAGRPAADCSDTVAAAALWAASRYGLTGPAIDPVSGKQTLGIVLLADLLDHVRPALAAAGDLEQVRLLVDRLLAMGTGAERQRRAAEHGMSAVLDTVAITAAVQREAPA